ncbi:DNA topoisomerase I [Candidatus Woesearchaeota archaeon]|nr:DNA topoisomerase I [Candidatus Woesearchaeota archaeon]MBW2994232.1 DNA topoisomerase I [Candidatus Woesearchaeota archaeon]
MYELIITEKPNASKRIAEALAEGKAIKENIRGVPYYKVTHKGKDLVIGCAVGHLFGLAEKNKKPGFKYPIFDIEWVPAFEISKQAAFSKKYFNALKKLAKDADSFTVACDYDIEGEVIGLNVVRFICNRNEARRMKFSTLTKPDVVKAYENAQSHLDWGQAEAGETRHFLDYYYGINLSRALTSAIKTAGMFKILSAGRVQAPALKIIVDREKEIQAFKPVPFWQIELNGQAKKKPIDAWHKEDKFWDKKNADAVMKKVKSEKTAVVNAVNKKQFKQTAPFPFDLTSLQTESYRCFGIRPKETLSLAQELYTNGIISYPRTSSQQLPAAIGYTKILKALAKQKDYKESCNKLLALKTLTPNNGKKTDPAHPAIYPTGVSKSLEGKHAKIYDLIVKRFMATFAESAVRETITAELHVKDEPFIAKGTRTVEKNWHEFYMPYVKLEEIELPAMNEGDEITIVKITMHDKETQPPKRYTQSSIIKALEKRGLGTKATRADIVERLYSRHYIKGESIEATDLGIQITAILEKYVPKIVDETLTRSFDEDMEEIRARKLKKDQVLKKAKTVVNDICTEFKTKEKDIGEGLRKTFTETRAAMQTVGKCMACDGTLVIKKGKFGLFVACDKYPDCKATFKLPSGCLVKVTEKVCEHCNHPMIRVIRKAKKPQEVCINPECSAKQIDVKIEEGRKCSKCGKGEMVLRKSVYGAFMACNKYPKCRNTESIDENGNPIKKKAKKKAKKKIKKKAKKKAKKKKVKKAANKE